MFAVGKTDIGKSREENQDKYRISVPDSDTVFAVVCDGMGGAQSGGLASEITSNCIYERIQLSYRKDMEPKNVKSMLISSVMAANTIVYNKSLEDEKCAGMGTTCVAAIYIATFAALQASETQGHIISTAAEYIRLQGITQWFSICILRGSSVRMR